MRGCQPDGQNQGSRATLPRRCEWLPCFVSCVSQCCRVRLIPCTFSGNLARCFSMVTRKARVLQTGQERERVDKSGRFCLDKFRNVLSSTVTTCGYLDSNALYSKLYKT